MKSVLTGPMASEAKPHARRPTADEKLKPATRPAPAEGDRPRLWEYRGEEEGGDEEGEGADCAGEEERAELGVREEPPLDERGRCDGRALFDEPGGWEAGG